MEPRLRNILSDASGAPIRCTDTFDTSNILAPSTVPLAQLLEPLPSHVIDPVLENLVSEVRREATTNPERTRLQPILDWLIDGEDRQALGGEWPGARDLESESVVLPPIQKPSVQESNAGVSVGTRPLKSSAPLAEVLNSTSPLAAARDVETLRGKELQSIVESNGSLEDGHNGEHEIGNSIPSSSKRRRVEPESTRILPRPSRKSTRRQQMPALLPPLLAPLHNPPVDARVVPSMNTDGPPRMSELKSPLPLPGVPTEREANQASQAQSTRQEDNREQPRRDGNPDQRKPERSSSRKNAMDPQLSETQQTGPISAADTQKKETSRRVKWTAEETQYLIDGVERFGIGSWKRILECEDYHFKGERNSIDLKDRFRTCFPDEYRRSGSQRGKVDSVLDATGKRRGRGGRTTVELQKMGVLQEHTPFPKQERRQRKHFTKAEDDALLRGFLKYPAQWKKIQMDPTLGLQDRTRTDLRDRFRNRYPQRFKEAGYVHKAKQGSPSLGEAAAEAEGDFISRELNESAALNTVSGNSTSLPLRTTDDIDLHNLLISATNQTSSHLEPPASNSKDEPTHALRLLAAGLGDSYNFSAMSIDEDDDDGNVAAIHLNRAIFDWADQNKLNMAAANGHTSLVLPSIGISSSNALRDGTSNIMRIDPGLLHASANDNTLSNANILGGADTSGDKIMLSAIDQLHVNSLDDTEKLPGLASLIASQATAGSASVPLSRILNGG